MKERKNERVAILRWNFSLIAPFHSFAFSISVASLVHSFALSLFLFFPATAQPRVTGVGPEGRYYPVHDFRDDFQVYDEGAKAYIPYILEQHAGQTALSAYVDLESNRHYSLLISTRRDGYLFINAALKRKLIADRWEVLSIDSLFRVYRQPEIFLTIYGAPGLDDKRVFIGYPKSATQKQVVLGDDNLSVRPRPQTIYDNFLSLGLLFLLATHACLFALYHRAFLRFYSLQDLISFRAQEESFLINRPLSSTNLLFTLNLGFVIGYLIIFVQSRNLDVFASRTLLLGEQHFGWLIGEFFLVSGVAFLSLIGKYVLLEVMGGLYKLQDIIHVHYFKIIQSSLLFFTALALLLSIIQFNAPMLPWVPNMLLLPLIGFYLGRLFLLYLVIRSLEPIKNLYLFSYLCIVELIPLIIGLRFAL
ncbi:DUF4271 domain-containing protein [Spirosoma radiotolerans]|uniref:DUF4271 domain-containing protein n=1 Tax=Spirosoma radiotolerans TaxID=1379870 RepID=A0A0E3V8L6_9BACT|nr:DUF4271 domain-containing protein [Spirosoma radiotolerans]AKD56411.1 hypothetical protein SD10_17340 [Spirosoma radiotolerans]